MGKEEMMIFAKREDVDRCAEIVRAVLEKRKEKSCGVRIVEKN